MTEVGNQITAHLKTQQQTQNTEEDGKERDQWEPTLKYLQKQPHKRFDF